MRARLLNHVKANFRTLDAAEEHYNLTLSNYLEEMEQSRDSEKRTPVKVVDKVNQNLYGEQSEIHDVAESKNLVNLKSLMAGLDSAELVELANLAFLELAIQNGINSNPANFAELVMHAMKRLQDNGKNNLIYKFALCIASNRPGSNDSLFPINRMPFGLMEFQIELFSATNIMGVGLLSDEFTNV